VTRATVQARKATLLLQLKNPALRDPTPRNREQRRILARAIQRAQAKPPKRSK